MDGFSFILRQLYEEGPSMKIIKNSGTDRVIEELRKSLDPHSRLDLVTSDFSLFAFSEVQNQLSKIKRIRIILPPHQRSALNLFGGSADRLFRNRLNARYLAVQCMEWIRKGSEVREASSLLPQSILIIDHTNPSLKKALAGNCPFTTEGLGITPGNQFGLIQCTERPEEWNDLAQWFESVWKSLPGNRDTINSLLSKLEDLVSYKAPSLLYFLILYHLFKDLGESLDEELIIKSATGIRNTVVWKKLYKFQKDGVVGAIDKLERHGGCIIADSVGLGKTFEALAIIKYYELRNDRVLVLCPKRLRENWTLYKINDRRNALAPDRFNYDVLNHTDLSRDNGMSGDIDLRHVNWENYDLVVIDESHNFRNKPAHKGRETRYDRLMKRIIKAGVRTRVLMLSATPVNNRLADLKNQIAFITEGNDGAYKDFGISSIEITLRQAQSQFNRWLKFDERERTSTNLLEILGFDYFRLLDLLTIARSRKHIERYYGTDEMGKFPERLPPRNIYADVDLEGGFPSIHQINREIRMLTLGSYAPLRYVLPRKRAAYDEKYSTRIQNGTRVFRQLDREESLVGILRVNLLKRMESSVGSFALSIERLLLDVKALLARIDSHEDSVEEIMIEDIEVDDPIFESLLVGQKVKVLLQDMDRIRWRQDLVEDRKRLSELLAEARKITPIRDAKLKMLRQVILEKCQTPINPDNRKILIFTAFADTAEFLYRELAPWAKKELGLFSGLVTGGGTNKTNLPKLKPQFGALLQAFSPRSKERGEEYAQEGEIDLLFATDCISEGQNLQDCDTLVNFDIHWNPVRIIQRFGRIDRIGSRNQRIQLVNFWPNIELDEYIALEQKVSGRMVLLDISTTGEENLIEQSPGNEMNDLEYRRNQLKKLQNTVIDLEDLSSGISITDLTLNDFRIDLVGFLKNSPGRLEALGLGTFAVTQTVNVEGELLPPGVIFCLRAEGAGSLKSQEPTYPLAPYYLVHVGNDGSVLLPFTRAKAILDRLKLLSGGRDQPDGLAYDRFERMTKGGQEMNQFSDLLSNAVSSIVGKSEERAIESLFAPGGTHIFKGEFQGVNDFEVIGYLVILPETVKE